MTSTRTTANANDGSDDGLFADLSNRGVADILQGICLVSTTKVLVDEIRQLRWYNSREHTLAAYISSGWNQADVVGFLAAYSASVAHFLNHTAVVRNMGGLAVLLSSVGVLQMLQPFKTTGPLIKTVIEIERDIRGFEAIIVVILAGFSCAFSVLMPESVDFFSDHAGPLNGILTMYQATLGNSEMEQVLAPLSHWLVCFCARIGELNLFPSTHSMKAR